jgi:hypothetical protein
MCAGSFNVESGEQALVEGQTDLIALGRALWLTLIYPLNCSRKGKTISGPASDATLQADLFVGAPLSCTVNPGVGTGETSVSKATASKKVLVIGGGVGEWKPPGWRHSVAIE